MKKVVCITLAAIFVPLLTLLYLKNSNMVSFRGLENITGNMVSAQTHHVVENIVIYCAAAVSAGIVILSFFRNSAPIFLCGGSLGVATAFAYMEHNFKSAGIILLLCSIGSFLLMAGGAHEQEKIDARRAIIEMNERQKRNGG